MAMIVLFEAINGLGKSGILTCVCCQAVIQYLIPPARSRSPMGAGGAGDAIAESNSTTYLPVLEDRCWVKLFSVYIEAEDLLLTTTYAMILSREEGRECKAIPFRLSKKLRYPAIAVNGSCSFDTTGQWYNICPGPRLSFDFLREGR